ncbi:MAG: LacI family transcriptional regulator [Actinomycetota bacterium]|nr:LacI family transcriptional regulator [Actinomycetota bacterium]
MSVDDDATSTRSEPRDSAPTLEEVAALAGVSRSTASRALNGGKRVSPTAQSAVDAAIAELGYTPNRAARSLVTRRTDSIALVIPEPDERVLTDPFFSGTLNGLSSALAGSDLQLVLLISRPGESERTERYLRNGHVDGAVVVSHHKSDLLDTVLADSRMPSVFVGRPLNEVGRLHYIDVDNYAGGRLAAEHIISTGRTRIGLLAGPQDMAAGRDRLRGWVDVLEANGLRTDRVVTSDFTAEAATDAMAELLEKHPDIDAVIAASDLIAVGALNVLHERGRSVPDEIVIIGFDNLGVSTSPALTTLTNPVVAMSRAAGHMLLDLLENGDREPQHTQFSPDLVVRASTSGER